mmetsp:Transcript_4784/g.10798  ORF Transcript_4784/g.10798 Transcript_4784/m.10798 type:complete len:204 (+) Transcript_4784:683-1294(+)
MALSKPHLEVVARVCSPLWSRTLQLKAIRHPCTSEHRWLCSAARLLAINFFSSFSSASNSARTASKPKYSSVTLRWKLPSPRCPSACSTENVENPLMPRTLHSRRRAETLVPSLMRGADASSAGPSTFTQRKYSSVPLLWMLPTRRRSSISLSDKSEKPLMPRALHSSSRALWVISCRIRGSAAASTIGSFLFGGMDAEDGGI